MMNLTEVALAPIGKRWKKGDDNFGLVRGIATSGVRQFSFEVMANGDIMKTRSGGNILLGLKPGDEFFIEATGRDLREINKAMRGHKRYVFFDVMLEMQGDKLFGVCI